MAKEQDDCHDENARQAMEAAEQRVKTAKDFGLDTLGSKQDRGGIPFGPQGRDTILGPRVGIPFWATEECAEAEVSGHRASDNERKKGGGRMRSNWQDKGKEMSKCPRCLVIPIPIPIPET